MLRIWGERLAAMPDYYLAHEYLEEVNAPTTIRDFTAAAAGHRLGYLSDCDISTMMADNYGVEVADYIQSRTQGHLVQSEQYLDILSGRSFRQSLLIAEERLAEVDRNIAPERLSQPRDRLADRPAAQDDDVEVRVTALLGRRGADGDRVARRRTRRAGRSRSGCASAPTVPCPAST